ncbi:hypothetical protein ACQZ4O_28215, partial [Agrobacterium vitis]
MTDSRRTVLAVYATGRRDTGKGRQQRRACTSANGDIFRTAYFFLMILTDINRFILPDTFDLMSINPFDAIIQH